VRGAALILVTQFSASLPAVRAGMNVESTEKKHGDQRGPARRTALRAAAGPASDAPGRPRENPFDLSVYQQPSDYGGMKWFYSSWLSRLSLL
jgi:hypothetical protein